MQSPCACCCLGPMEGGGGGRGKGKYLCLMCCCVYTRPPGQITVWPAPARPVWVGGRGTSLLAPSAVGMLSRFTLHSRTLCVFFFFFLNDFFVVVCVCVCCCFLFFSYNSCPDITAMVDWASTPSYLLS